jgi:hypothetical protein
MSSTGMRETMLGVTVSSNTVTLNYAANNCFYISAAVGAAFSISLTNVPTLDTNVQHTIVLLYHGEFLQSTIQLNGVTQSLIWPNGTAPTLVAGTRKILTMTVTYCFTPIGYVVFANLVQSK